MKRLFQFQELLQASHELDTQLAKVRGQLQEAQKHVSYCMTLYFELGQKRSVLNFLFVLAERQALRVTDRVGGASLHLLCFSPL